MNIANLVKKLDEIGVPKRYYSINGDLLPDAYILNNIYGKWEYFYYDEKGNRNDYKSFDTENGACMHMLSVLTNEMKC